MVYVAAQPLDTRKGFDLFTGSAREGERLAATYPLVDNGLLFGVDLFVYPLDAITKLEAGRCARCRSSSPGTGRPSRPPRSAQ